MTTKRAQEFLEELTGGALTLGELLRSLRVNQGKTQKEFADKLGISVQHLCNIERGLKSVSIERAVKFAQIIRHSERQFIRLALQDEVSRAGQNYRVELKAA